MDHYTVAVEMLREEERRSGGAPGDALWLAAALEGHVFCLYSEAQDKFSTELVEKASEAVALYAKAGTVELESLLIENLGWYYAAVSTATLRRSSMAGEAKVLESLWTKRLLWDVLERGLVLFPELQSQRQVEFLVQTSRMLETVGHRRRVALFLHEAASLLLARNAPSVDSQLRLVLSPSSVTKGSQRQRDLEAALLIERVAAESLGIQGKNARKDALPWEVTTQYRRNRRKKAAGSDDAFAGVPDNSWLIIRFHVLRQLLTIARMLGDAFLVGTYCLQLLEMLVWCDSIAEQVVDTSSPAMRKSGTALSTLLVDHLQQPATSLRVTHAPTDRTTTGLHAKGGVYFSPPPGIDTRIRRNFINSPSATMSNAAASLSSTLTNTPRILATPRQQFSAAVNAISTKASPAFTSFSHNGNMTNRAGGGEEHAPALRVVANMTDGREFGSAGVNGDAGGLKTSRTLGGYDSDSDGRLHIGVQTETIAVWNLRSKTEIAKIERKLLNLLESDCTALRASEQVQLPTFLRVDKLKLRSSCNLQHPFLSRATALGMFGVQSASNQQALKSDFFYSPFEKQKMMRKAAQRGGNEEDAVDDAPAMYERGFPVHERIELQLTLSNPTGAAVKLQQVKAWVTFVEEESGADAMDTNALLRDDAVESYPSFLTLGPYEKRKTVMLGVQPLRVGTFHVRGCFIKAFNITTSFTLKDPVTIRVVGELPMVSLSLREHGSMALSEGEKAVATKLSPASNMRIVMFATETKRCMVRVRSTGNQQITHYRLAVNVQHRRAAKKTCVIFNNLPPASADTVSATVHTPANPKTSSGQVETQALSLRCSKIVSSPLPLCSGDFVSIPFEVFLRGKKDPGEPLEDDIQIEWSFVYADESCSGEVYYRESKLSLELISLPSLMLRSVALLPCSVEQIPAEKIDRTLCDSDALSTTDHLYCAIMVHIVNPTETTFRFRLHRDMDGSGEAICEAEIGRQCSRRFVVEVPRFPALDEEQGPTKLTDMLNDLLEMEWDTYFGTQGRLRCEEYHLGPIAEQDEMQRELVLPPVSFQIHSPIEAPTSLVGGKPQNGDIIEMKQGRHGTVALHPLNFFQATHLRAESRTLHAALFQYVPIDVTIQRTFNTGDGEQQVSGVELEVVITEEGNERVFEVSEHVVVVGLLKTQVTWSGPTEEAVKNHEVQCMFLSEGNFRVMIRKLLWDELKLNVRASEEGELRSAIGSHLIEGNEDLRQELAVLVEILTEFQQQNDDIRVGSFPACGVGLKWADNVAAGCFGKAATHSGAPRRPLLIEKLKLLAADMHGPSRQVAIRSAKDSEVLDYVLSTSDTFNPSSYQAPMTPKMEGVSPRSISNDPVDGVALRPGTATGWRPTTSGSQRPVSRGSTISVSSIAAVLDSPEVHHRLNLDEIDAIKEDLREALNDEHQLLLEDIDFIQGCLEMEKDLIDDDRRKVTAVKPPPSLSDLHDLRKTLEKTLEDQVQLAVACADAIR
ncbi:hypothetical protein ON010_g3124 [Phytophthora cinnamomi]|nr:hypothetical protein ON010_g3124 [Phytophthora cinnamomi]